MFCNARAVSLNCPCCNYSPPLVQLHYMYTKMRVNCKLRLSQTHTLLFSRPPNRVKPDSFGSKFNFLSAPKALVEYSFSSAVNFPRWINLKRVLVVACLFPNASSEAKIILNLKRYWHTFLFLKLYIRTTPQKQKL